MPPDPRRNHPGSTTASMPDTAPVHRERVGYRTHNGCHCWRAENPLRHGVIVRPRLEVHSITNSLHPLLASQINLTNEISPWRPLESDCSIDKMPITSAGELALRRELRQHIIDCQPFRRSGLTDHRTMAAPEILFGSPNDPSPHGIEDHVT